MPAPEKLNQDIGTLRFITACLCDEGKGTLIGRLLHDTQSILDDQMLVLENFTARHGRATAKKKRDISLLTKGMRSERRQGVAIVAAHSAHRRGGK